MAALQAKFVCPLQACYAMNPSVTLSIDDGFLRPLDLADLHPGYVEGLNNPDINRHLEVRLTVQTIETVAAFVNTNRQDTDSVLFGIWLHAKSSHIGTIRLYEINQHLHNCFIGICIFDKSVWGRGIGTNAIKAVTKWAHVEMNMHRIEAHAYLDNTASIRSFEKAGYRRIPDRFKNIPGAETPVRHAALVSDEITQK
jgi:ribosomal-protein-alanine N-acetyltransferase